MSGGLRGIVLASIAAVLSLGSASAALGSPRFLSPAPNETLAPGSIVELRWTAVCRPGSDDDEAEVVLSLDGGVTFPIRVSNELSPCETHFRWRVPSLASERARLAVRSGAEGRMETEALTLLSGEFRILADREGGVQRLLRRLGEWWAPPEPTARTAEDLLERTMSPARSRIVLPGRESEIDTPRPPLTLCPAPMVAASVTDRSVAQAIIVRGPSRIAGPAIPLRL